MHTYLNLSKLPMIRNCKNCAFWLRDKENVGYCKKSSMHFAYTLEKNLYYMTKEFYVCDKHNFHNEETLEKTAEKVSLKDSLKKKDEVQ